MAVAAAAVRHCRSNMQRRMELAEKKTKNNQPEVAVAVVAAAVVAMVAVAVVAWRLLPCDIFTAASSAG